MIMMMMLLMYIRQHFLNNIVLILELCNEFILIYRSDVYGFGYGFVSSVGEGLCFYY